jgi:hypothetical protein
VSWIRHHLDVMEEIVGFLRIADPAWMRFINTDTMVVHHMPTV